MLGNWSVPTWRGSASKKERRRSFHRRYKFNKQLKKTTLALRYAAPVKAIATGPNFGLAFSAGGKTLAISPGWPRERPPPPQPAKPARRWTGWLVVKNVMLLAFGRGAVQVPHLDESAHLEIDPTDCQHIGFRLESE